MELKKENLRNVAGGKVFVVVGEENKKIPVTRITGIRLVNEPATRSVLRKEITALEVDGANGVRRYQLDPSDYKHIVGGRAAERTTQSVIEPQFVIVVTDAKGNNTECTIRRAFMKELIEKQALRSVLKDEIAAKAQSILRCAGNGGNFVPGQ